MAALNPPSDSHSSCAPTGSFNAGYVRFISTAAALGALPFAYDWGVLSRAALTIPTSGSSS